MGKQPGEGSKIPVSIRSKFHDRQHGVSFVAVGKDLREAMTGGNGYWIAIVNLKDAKIVAADLAKSNDKVPDFVQPYVGKPDYAMILAAADLMTDNLPQGSFAKFLRLTGSGDVLHSVEQYVSQQAKSGAYEGVSYILAATLDQSDAPGFEAASFFGDSWMTLDLVPYKMGDSTVYMLVKD